MLAVRIGLNVRLLLVNLRIKAGNFFERHFSEVLRKSKVLLDLSL